MFIVKGFTVKESKKYGASGNMALLTMARYKRPLGSFVFSLTSYPTLLSALMALPVMHNYAPAQYNVA